MVSYCDRPMSIVRRQQFALNNNASYTLAPISIKPHRNVAYVTLKKKKAKTVRSNEQANHQS